MLRLFPIDASNANWYIHGSGLDERGALSVRTQLASLQLLVDGISSLNGAKEWLW